MLTIRSLLIILSFVLCLLIQGFNLKAQNGGQRIYEFLNTGISPYVESIGGEHIALRNIDAVNSLYNISSINKNYHNELSLAYIDYISNLNFGNISYAYRLTNKIMLSSSICYFDYGKFKGRDIYGNETSDFTANDFVFKLGASIYISKLLRFGLGIKPIFSKYENYSSNGIAADISLSYTSKDTSLMLSAQMKNMGIQLKPYYGSNREHLPFVGKIGMSYRFKQAPITTYLTYNNIQEFDLSYESELEEEKDNVVSNISKHLIVGADIEISKTISIRAGYNFKRRKELKIENRTSTVGLSWGFGLNFPKFKITYASAKYHLAGKTNYFGISTNLNNIGF
ncbi:MAG: type IX secretion system protein PorQ [Marinifilaceae bacterium]|jgi:hypothetical protein|nr:type IX secretion system protein PorQ [Marinifilaceae bacterium]